MKTQHIITSICLATSLSAMAVPAKRTPFTVVQPDGTTLTVSRVGDERFHAMKTSDGMAVAFNGTDSYCYLSTDGITSVVAHEPELRSPEEVKFLNLNAPNVSLTAVAEKALARNTARKALKGAAKVASTTDLRISADVPATGTPRIPVLLVAYKDKGFSDKSNALSYFKNFFQTGDKSANKYFVDQSNGLFNPQFDVYGPVTLSNNRSVYGGNDIYGDDKGVGAMVAEACQSLNTSIDFSKYDNDGDGVCDVVIVVYAGDGEASSGLDDSENSVWPCQWYLSESDFDKSLRLDNVTVDKFAVFNELSGNPYNPTEKDGVGTVAHEFSHCIGLPDFYQTSKYATVSFSMDAWSIMDYGCYNDNGYTPLGYSAFEKYSLGWIALEEPSGAKQYTLPVFNTGKDNDVALKLTSPNSNEYYILENRQTQGWDKYMSSRGLMITHVTYNKSKWDANTLNNAKPMGYCIVPADNSLSHNTLSGDLWPYGGKDEFTDNSSPAATLNFTSGQKLGKPITDITQNADGTVSLWFNKGATPEVESPTMPSDDEMTNDFVETSATYFVARWYPSPLEDEADDVTYSLKVSVHSENSPENNLFGKYDFAQSPDNNWSADGSVEHLYLENPGYKLASNKKTGSITSPVIQLPAEHNSITVSFDAAAYSTSENEIQVIILDSKLKEVSKKSVNLTTSYANYVVTLSANAGQENYVRFYAASKKRCYVSAADIYYGTFTTDDLKAPAMKAPSDLLFENIQGTSFKVEGLTPGESYDYRVKTVATFNGVKAESAWSKPVTVTLRQTDGIDTVSAEAGNPAEYYTLQGVRVGTRPATPGIYIRRTANTTTKVVVR